MTLQPPPRVKLTYADYLTFPADGQRHEIVAGEHHVSAAPLPRHQLVVTRLTARLVEAIDDAQLGTVFGPSPAVRLGEFDVVEPDVTVLLRQRRHLLTATCVLGAPSLVVEVLSPRTRRFDREDKKEAYERHGVPEYWLVDPDARTVEQWVLRDGIYVLAATATDRITLAIAPDVTVDLRRVWTQPAPPDASR